jgi:hypothetical protein
MFVIKKINKRKRIEPNIRPECAPFTQTRIGITNSRIINIHKNFDNNVIGSFVIPAKYINVRLKSYILLMAEMKKITTKTVFIRKVIIEISPGKKVQTTVSAAKISRH